MKSKSKLFAITLFLITALFAGMYAAGSLTVQAWAGNIEMRVTPQSEWVRVVSDMEIPEKAQIRLNGKNDYLVLQFPDGSEIKLAGTTMIEVKDIIDQKGGKLKSGVKLIMGSVVANVKIGQSQDFKVETESAVAAVRGTSFGVNYSAGDSSGNVVVFKGKVAVSDPKGGFSPVLITPGNYSAFTPGKITPPSGAPQELFDSFDEPLVAAAPLEEYSEPGTEPVKDGGEPDKTIVTPVEIPTMPTDTQNTQGQTVPQPALGPSKSDECSSEGLSWSVSSESIDGTVWNKVLLSPTFKLADGKFVLSLYLPVYFQNLDDLMDNRKWYNYTDWDFSTSMHNPDAGMVVMDILHDLLMKIRYMGIRTDNFLFKLGSIPDFKIGHGILVDGYANDLQFPSLRKVGFQMNIDFGAIGLETMMADAFETKLMAGRFFVRPFSGTKLAFGLSSFLDAGAYSQSEAMVYGYSFDVDFPLLDIGIFSMTLFADVASLGYWDTVNDPKHFIGWGLSTGLTGMLLIFDYRFEFRSYNNGFIGHYVDRLYDGGSRDINYLTLTSGTAATYNGFLVYIGKSWEKIGGAYLSFEQMYPSLNAVISNLPPNNFLHLEVYVDKCLVKKAYGKIMYDRKNFAAEKFFTDFLGDGTVLTAQVFYEIADATYVGLTYKRFYETVNGAVVAKDTYGLETQLGL